MFSEKIASSRPNFYINGAWQLELASNYKGAEKFLEVFPPSAEKMMSNF